VSPVERPRVLFVGRNRLSLPLRPWVARKWDAVGAELDFRVLGTAVDGRRSDDGRFALDPPAACADGALFYLRLPARVRREIRTFRPDAIVAADPFVGAAALAGRALSGRRPRVIVEVHGDWRTFARLYGSPARRLVAAPAEWLARLAVRRADATRAVSSFTSGIVEEVRGEPATQVLTAYTDLSAFTAQPLQPLPDRPTALFVGALERYKNVDGLAAAWRQVAARLPEARLVVVGKGSRPGPVEALLRELPGRVEHVAELPPEGVAERLDKATVLVLPSWPEGLGLVVIEAFARGRGIVATDAGGIPDLVRHSREGLLVPPNDTAALSAALLQVLSDRTLAERLGQAAAQRYEDWHFTPERYATGLRRLVDATLAAAR
jgi:glycosyltransferase involved in cell wall biosynthesis